MRIKTLTAPKMEDALRIIRQQLGPEALILSTRKIKGEDGLPTLEITAAVNEDEPRSKPVEATPLAEVPSSAPAKPSTNLFTSMLEAHGLPAAFTAKITAALPGLQSAGFSQPEALEMLLAKLITFKTPGDLLPAGKAHLFIGPQGAGKTTLVAKLAIHAKKQGRTVGILSLDDQKIGGFEPLAIAAEILGEHAHLITTPNDLKSAGKELGPRHLLLIDSAGLNPYAPQTLNALQKKLSTLGIPALTHLVLPAPLNLGDMTALPVACHRFNISSLIFTKLDATSRYGALLTTAEGSRLPIGIATHNPDMSVPPLTLTAQWLAEGLTQLPHQPWDFAS
ncbi:MAG: hypothetical protein GC129_03070 [Proteobacteria bacterium]|nr:hypothetical protein [Pseudomonadota bacterium]